MEAIDAGISLSLVDLFKELGYKYLEYDLSHPLESKVLLNAYRRGDNLKADFHRLHKGKDFLLGLIAKEQNSGQIKKEYDPEIIFFCLIELSLGMERFARMKLGISYDDILQGGIEKYEKELVNIFDQFVNILVRGFGT